MAKIMTAFFSRSGENYMVGNVENGSGNIAADIISSILGAPSYRIERKEDYPSDYNDCNKEAQRERNENERPALRSPLPDMTGVDALILVYPNWWGDLPMPVYTFLDGIDTDGLSIYPVCTHEGNGLGMTDRCIMQAYPSAKVMKGLALRGTLLQNDRDKAEAAVREYLSKSGLAG